MKLGQALESLDSFDADQTIYVQSDRPIGADSEVVVDFYSDDGEPPPSAAGMTYLLEVSIARDVLRVWSEWRNGGTPSTNEMVGAVVYYAEHDAFQPVKQ
jgi:hypothetical protein